MQATPPIPGSSGRASRPQDAPAPRRRRWLARPGIAALLLGALSAAGVGRATAADTPSCSALAAGGPACSAEPVGSVAGGSDAGRFVGNPIDVVTGNKYQRREDYRAFGSRLSFSRHYNTAQTDVDIGLGRGWRHDYDVSLARAGESVIRVFQSDGRQIDFEAVGIDAALEAGIDASVLSTGAVAHLPPDPVDGYLLHGNGTTWAMPDGRELAFRGPLLASVAWPDGDRLSLAYERGRLARVTDRHGRALHLEYTPGRRGLDGWEPRADVALPGHLERVVLPGGDALEYRYDNRRNLTRVDHAGREVERLAYTDRDWPNHLTGLDADGQGKRWHYDDEGRGDGYADGLGSVLMLEYLPEPADSSGVRVGRTLVKRADGAYLDYRWSMDAGGRAEVGAVIEHGCATCVGVPRSPPVRNRDDGTDTGSADPIDGVRIERLGGNTAIVTTESVGSPIALKFDRRGRVIEARTEGQLGAGSAELDELVTLLNTPLTVNEAGLATRRRGQQVCPLPVFRTCDELYRDLEMAKLSACAYADSGGCSAHWDEVDPAELDLTPDDLVGSGLFSGGFHARIFRHRVTGEIVIAFRGTDDIQDAGTDAQQHGGAWDGQYQMAYDLAKKLEQNGHSPSAFTGHSLGGGLATTAALASNTEAIVFNSAALVPETADRYDIDLAKANTLVTNVVVPGEVVTKLQEVPYTDPTAIGRDDDYHGRPVIKTAPAPGKRVVLNEPDPNDLEHARLEFPGLVRGLLPRDAEYAAARHVATSVLSSLYATLRYQCIGASH